MQKFTLYLKKFVFFSISLFLCIFFGFQPPEEGMAIIQNTLAKHYDVTANGSALKRYELNVTNTGFCKYKKVYVNGKTEFFSFNLSRFKSMSYLGSTTKGELHLQTDGEHVIVQTHNDKMGNVDSMATQMIIPLKDIEVEQLNLLATSFKTVNSNLMASNR